MHWTLHSIGVLFSVRIAAFIPPPILAKLVRPFLILCSVFLVQSFGPAAYSADIIGRVLARSSAIHTVRFKVHVVEEFDGAPAGTPFFIVTKQNKDDDWSLVAGEPLKESRKPTVAETNMTCLFAETQWKIDLDRNKVSRVSRNGITMTYYDMGKGKKRNRSLLLQDKATSYEGDETQDRLMRKVVRFGAIPNFAIEQFVKVNRSSCNITELANDLIELKWTLNQKQVESLLGTVPIYIYSGATSDLILIVSPSQGYSVTRVDFRNTKGESKYFFNASEFIDCGDELFMPQKFEEVCNDFPNFYKLEAIVSDYSLVNSPIADSSFSLQIPEGTRVRCVIPGKQCTFEVGKLTTVDSIDTAIASQIDENIEKSPTKRSVMFGLAVAVLVGFGIFTLYRRKSS